MRSEVFQMRSFDTVALDDLRGLTATMTATGVN